VIGQDRQQPRKERETRVLQPEVSASAISEVETTSDVAKEILPLELSSIVLTEALEPATAAAADAPTND